MKSPSFSQTVRNDRKEIKKMTKYIFMLENQNGRSL